MVRLRRRRYRREKSIELPLRADDEDLGGAKCSKYQTTSDAESRTEQVDEDVTSANAKDWFLHS
jgi:hypothetical protein